MILAFVSSIANGQEQSVLTVVQLLWLNLVQDTLAALALATDPPTVELLHRKPEPKQSSIITLTMWKMIMGQALLQLIIAFVLIFAGSHIFTTWSQAELNTVVFNTFVWLQISNQLNCRRIDNRLNAFYGMGRNFLFLAITFFTIAGQILIIFVGGTAFSVTRLNGVQWLTSIILGLLSLPVGVVIRLIPDDLIRRVVPSRALHRRRRTPTTVEPIVEEGLNPAIKEVQEIVQNAQFSSILEKRGGFIQGIIRNVPFLRSKLVGTADRGSSQARDDFDAHPHVLSELNRG